MNIQKYFDEIQPKYYVNEIASLGFTRLFRRFGVQKIKNYGDKRVLDIMSGQGENLKYLQCHNESTKIYTLDFSASMSKSLAKNFKGKFEIEQIETDFFQNKIPSNSMDVILCSYGTKTIDSAEIEKFADELSRIIDINGEIVIVEFVKPKIGWRSRCTKWYIEDFVAKLFGKEFKILFEYINKNESLDDIKNHLLRNKFEVLSSKRYLDLVEILHVKKGNID